MVEKSKLDEDREGKAVDPSHYRGFLNVEISSLMYMNFSVDQMFLHIIVLFAWIMATTIEQQTALDESLVPSSQRAFQVTADVPEIYMQEFWVTAKLHHHSIRFKIDARKSVLDLEAFREMLHISPRIPNQPFADLPTEEEVLDFLRFLGHSQDIRYLTDPSISRRNRIHWHYVRDDALFSTIKVESRHQATQQYGAILPIELTTAEIRNSK
nr:hypothetical protein [Tanacetum cinerariifolium]